MKLRRYGLIKLAVWGLLLSSLPACHIIKGEQAGIVLARRAQLRSSTAVVAADLLEVTRGDQVDILDTSYVEDTKEKWMLVRAHDDDRTEGWIEARNIMPQEILEKSQELAAQDKDIPSQAAGQLRAASNLRLTPDRATSDNVIMKMESGASFEIVGWQYMEIPKGLAGETDAARSAVTSSPNPNSSGAPANNNTDGTGKPVFEEKYELWYRVRLIPSISPAPAGWIFARQVELQVPGDIIFYRIGREFVSWARLDGSGNLVGLELNKQGEEDLLESKPGSWVILEKSKAEQPHEPGEPDFDHILVMGYDRDNQEHYTVYKSPELKGYLPLRVANNGDEKAFTVKVKNESGAEQELHYSLFRNERGILKINIPDNVPKKAEDEAKKK